MKVILSTIGRFHIFPLAKELEKNGLLECIYSGFPWSKLEREGVSKKYVRTFPWIRPLLLGTRFLPFSLPEPFLDGLHQLSVETLDRYVAKKMSQADIFVGHEGVGLISGAEAKKQGMLYVCDRGCTHMAWRERILQEENARLGLKPRRQPNTFHREIKEYDLADLIVVPSQFVANSFISEGIPVEKIAIVPYGVNLEMFHPAGKPPENSFEIIFVGRISARKGIKDLLDGFNKANIPNKKLTLVGTLDQEIKDIFDEQLSADNIELKGHVSQSELKNLLSRSHVFCLPSIEDGFGMAVGEAMACGCPVIVTENAGGASIVNDGKNGYIIPIRSPENLAEKFEKLSFNPELRNKMGEDALASVQSLGGWQHYGQEMISLYKRVLFNKNSVSKR